MSTFMITGSVDGVARTIAWEDGIFNDPSGAIDRILRTGRSVALTPTGPFYAPGPLPIETAVVTALAAFDDRSVVISGDAPDVLDEIHRQIELEIGSANVVF